MSPRSSTMVMGGPPGREAKGGMERRPTLHPPTPEAKAAKEKKGGRPQRNNNKNKNKQSTKQQHFKQQNEPQNPKGWNNPEAMDNPTKKGWGYTP